MLWNSYAGAELAVWAQENRMTGQDDRARRLQVLEAVWLGIQYDGRPYLWDGRSVENCGLTGLVPIAGPQWSMDPSGKLPDRSERIPSFRSGLGGLIVDRFSDLLFGGARRPKVQVEGDPDTTSWVEGAFEQADGWAAVAQARDFAGALGSEAVLVRVTDGSYRFDVLNPRHCRPTFAPGRRTELVLERLEEVYPFEVEELDQETRRWKTSVRWYRRVVDVRTDSIWRETMPPAGESRAPVGDEWGAPTVVVEHGLGFVPVVWGHNLPATQETDGISDLNELPGNIETLDYLLSEGSAGAIANLDATLLIVGVKRDKVGVAATGHHTALVLEDPQASARFLELAGSSTEAGAKQVALCKATILEKAQVVLLDPKDLPGMGQGKDALESVYRAMLGRCDKLRTSQEKFLRRLVDFVVELGRKAQVKLPPLTATDAQGKTTSTERKIGRGGAVCFRWPSYFEPSADDRQKETAAADGAKRGGLLSLETLVRHLAPLYGVEDVAAELDRVRAEAKAAEAKAKAAAKAMQPTMPGLEDGAQDDEEDEGEGDGEDGAGKAPGGKGKAPLAKGKGAAPGEELEDEGEDE